MTKSVVSEEYDAYDRLGYSQQKMTERQKSYWENLQTTDGLYLITQAQKDLLDELLSTQASSAHWQLTSETATTISVADTLYKMAGTTTGEHLYDFTHSNNRLTYTGTLDKNFQILGTMCITGSANDDVALQLKRYDASTATLENIGPEVPVTLKSSAGSNRIENITIAEDIILSTNDYIEVWIKDISGTGSLTAKIGSHLLISRSF